MAEHHLPPEPAADQGGGGKGSVHADELKPAQRRGYSNYYGGDAAEPLRTVCFVVLVILLVAGITMLVLYLVYRPSTPAFAVTSVAVYSLLTNAASAGAPNNAVAASFQCTLVIRNPNGRASARYDRLAAYVAYRGEAITRPAEMPPLAQEPDSAVVVALVIGGGPLPVSPDTAAALANEVSYGVVSIRVVLLGRVRFVAGPFRRGWRSMYARCDLLVGVRNRKGPDGSVVGAAGVHEQAPLLGNPACEVDI